MKLVALMALLLATSPAAAQTLGTSTSQACTQDPTYCSDIGASTSTTMGSGTSGSTSSGGSGGSSSSGGAGAGAPPVDPQRPVRQRFPHRCLGWLQLNGRPTLVRCVTPAQAPSLTAAHSN
jgi:hypothetical protein